MTPGGTTKIAREMLERSFAARKSKRRTPVTLAGAVTLREVKRKSGSESDCSGRGSTGVDGARGWKRSGSGGAGGATPGWLSANDEHWDRSVGDGALGHAPEKEPLDGADTSGTDDEHVGVPRGVEELPKRAADPNLGLHAPPCPG